MPDNKTVPQYILDKSPLFRMPNSTESHTQKPIQPNLQRYRATKAPSAIQPSSSIALARAGGPPSQLLLAQAPRNVGLSAGAATSCCLAAAHLLTR
jgi:hypothetical protein